MVEGRARQFFGSRVDLHIAGSLVVELRDRRTAEAAAAANVSILTPPAHFSMGLEKSMAPGTTIRSKLQIPGCLKLEPNIRRRSRAKDLKGLVPGTVFPDLALTELLEKQSTIIRGPSMEAYINCPISHGRW